MKCSYCGSPRNLIYLNSTKTKTICLSCHIVKDDIEKGYIKKNEC